MSLLEMSVSGGVLIVVVILVRALAINRLPKTTFTALWMIALARLLIPVSIPSVFSVYSLLGSTSSISFAEQGEGVAVTPVVPSIGTQEVNAPAIPAVNHGGAESTAFSFTLVWLVGAIIAAAAFGAAYFLCFKRLRQAKKLSDKSVDQWLDSHRIRRNITVKSSGHISTPLTYGLFRPVIILPESMDLSDRERLGYVLSHEIAHIRRFDLLRKLTVILAACLHWFNPLVWVMLVIFNRDIELACDEAVVSKAGHSSRKAYAMALINMEEQRSVAGTLYSCFNKNAVEERIVAIMKITRPTLIRLAISAAIVLVVCLGFATTAYANQDKDKKEPTPAVISAADIDEFISPAEIIPEGDEVSPEETIETNPENAPEVLPNTLSEAGSEVAVEAEPEEIPETTADNVTETTHQTTAENASATTTATTRATTPVVAVVGQGWVWPVDSHRITRAFGPSSNPDRASSDHITIACNQGDTIVSAISGRVTEAAFAPEYGNYVVISGDNNVRIMYAHLKDISVSAGQNVSAGSKVGTAGATGMVTGVCLAFYVYVDDRPVDPVSFYD